MSKSRGIYNRELTDQQEAFICYYLTHEPIDAVAAYVAVYGDKGTERKNQQNASAVFCRLKTEIQKRRKELLEMRGLSEDGLALKLITIAGANKEDKYYTPQMQLKAIELLQKQLGIQKTNQKVDAQVNQMVQFVNDIKDVDDEDTTE